jgi:hypothetical protein
MTHLEFREQLARDLVLAAEEMAARKGDRTRKNKPNIVPVVPSGDKSTRNTKL